MREIATMLVEEIADPRLEMVTISGVRMNKDNKIAEVMFTMSGDKDKIDAAVSGLEKAKGFIRSKLSKRIRTRQIPELRFIHDNFLEDLKPLANVTACTTNPVCQKPWNGFQLPPLF